MGVLQITITISVEPLEGLGLRTPAGQSIEIGRRAPRYLLNAGRLAVDVGATDVLGTRGAVGLSRSRLR